MKKKLWIYSILILFILLVFSISYYSYNINKNIRIEKSILESYTIHTEIYLDYKSRISNKEEGLLDEINSKIEGTKDPLYLGTYKKALSYYNLYQNGPKLDETSITEAITCYEQSPLSAPLILDTYSLIISNSIAVQDYSTALKYCYASMEKLDEMDYSFISESFNKDIEILLNCNFINIFINNNLSASAKEYYDAIKDIKKDDPLYIKNSKPIVFAKLLYTDALGDYEEALNLSMEYLDLVRAYDEQIAEGMKINTATAMVKNNMADEALEHILAAEKYFLEEENGSRLGNVYTVYGRYYLLKGNYEEAYNKFKLSYDILKNDPNYIMDQITNLEELLFSHLKGNLTNDVTPYLEEYLLINMNSLEDEHFSNLFYTMNEINNKSYETKLNLQKKDQENLEENSKYRSKLIILLSIILILFIIFNYVLFNEIKTRKSYEKQLQNLVDTDALTNCYSRSYGFKTINNLIKFKEAFSIAILDIDNFKHINDTYGHPTGDKVLKTLGNFLIEKLDASNIAIRYGGEEFIIILKDKNIEESLIILNNLRSEFSNITFNDILTFTISIGAKKWEGESFDELISETDKLLYKAKKTGKNKVCIK